MKKILLAVYLVIFSLTTHVDARDYSGESYNWSTGEYNSVDVTFSQGSSEVEVYNWDTGETQYHDIDTSRRTGSGVELDTYNWNTGEYNTIELGR
tara:strand:+ start:116 stop:400 length:285 start_codon:yes stop_codon:yes gene_type:complete